MFNFSIILVYTEMNKYNNTKYLLAEKNWNSHNLHRSEKKKVFYKFKLSEHQWLLCKVSFQVIKYLTEIKYIYMYLDANYVVKLGD